LRERLGPTGGMTGADPGRHGGPAKDRRRVAGLKAAAQIRADQIGIVAVLPAVRVLAQADLAVTDVTGPADGLETSANVVRCPRHCPISG